MRKILGIALLILLLFPGNTLAFQNLNGENWNNLNEGEKTSYLSGLQTGMNTFRIIFEAATIGTSDYKKIEKALRSNDEVIEWDETTLKLFNDYFKENPNENTITLLINLFSDNGKEESENVLTKNRMVEYLGFETELYEQLIHKNAILYIYFSNNSDKVLKGIHYNIELYNNFGELVGQSNSEAQITIEQNSRGFHYYDFNSRMNSTIYNLIANDTLKVKVKI